MNQTFVCGSLLNLSLSLFKIAMPISSTGEAPGRCCGHAILYGENLGISLLLMSLPHVHLPGGTGRTGLGKLVLLDQRFMGFPATAEITLSKIGADGAWGGNPLSGPTVMLQ
jgi:hypothetical protein